MRLSAVAICCVVLCCVAIQAQQAAQQPKPATISGIVVKSNNAEPVKKARVTLYGSSGREFEPLTAVTDASGAFQFTNVAPGEYRAVASRSGYATRALGRSGAGQLLNVSAGQQVHNVVLRLAPSAAVTVAF
jgi:hypothetical protein